jgi:hypothetical protein
MPDTVNHPPHYNDHPSGVECIAIVEHFTFNVGNAVKYLWRAGLKGDRLRDCRLLSGRARPGPEDGDRKHGSGDPGRGAADARA